MTYNVFGGTLSLPQSINQSTRVSPTLVTPLNSKRIIPRANSWWSGQVPKVEAKGRSNDGVFGEGQHPITPGGSIFPCFGNCNWPLLNKKCKL